MKINYPLLLLFALMSCISCDNSQNEIAEIKEPDYLSVGNKTFNINVNETLELEGTLVSVTDDFVSEIKGNSIVGNHVGETEIVMKGAKGTVKNKIAVSGSYNIIKQPFLMKSPDSPLPIPTSVLFNELGEVGYFYESNGTWHKGCHIATYDYGDVVHYYITGKHNSSSIECIEIRVPINSNNLLSCSTFLSEHFEYLANIDGEEYYYHKTKGVLDYNVKFFKHSTRKLYCIEYSMP